MRAQSVVRIIPSLSPVNTTIVSSVRFIWRNCYILAYQGAPTQNKFIDYLHTMFLPPNRRDKKETMVVMDNLQTPSSNAS